MALLILVLLAFTYRISLIYYIPMARLKVSSVVRTLIAMTSFCLIYLLIFDAKEMFTSIQSILHFHCERDLQDTAGTQNLNSPYGWRTINDTKEEESRLHDLATVVATGSESAENKIPTVPCLSADKHLLVLSASASRVRYGVSVTFIMVFPIYVKTVLPKDKLAKPISSNQLSLWCIFSDGSVTPAYSYGYSTRLGAVESVSLLDCPLSSFASDELWRHNRTLRVYLASTTGKTRKTPILKAFVTVPISSSRLPNSNQQTMTLCTSPLHNKAHYLVQWIEFHRLVGFRKFVVYNTTDTHNHLSSIISAYSRKYPNLVDIAQWNFSSLGLTDRISSRYFQVEALHDCLIRYGDQSEWLGMIDLDEYIVPLSPYETVAEYLTQHFGRRIIGSVNMWSQDFCTKNANKYTSEEKNTSRLVIERFTLRAKKRDKSGREKYLYRPRFVQYLSIHHQIIGMSKVQSSENHIALAHYVSMDRLRLASGCRVGQYVKDINIRDRFASRIQDAIALLYD